MFLFMYVRALISAAVRLNIVGPYAGQQCLARAEPRVRRIVDGWWARDTAAAAPRQTNPLLDLLQGHHDRLYSKMFSS